jgi:uncharacterized protein
MRIVLLGATGFVGAALLSEALSRGHEVTAIARHPEKLEGQENLAVKAGDVYDTDGLASLIAGHDALISAHCPVPPCFARKDSTSRCGRSPRCGAGFQSGQ